MEVGGGAPAEDGGPCEGAEEADDPTSVLIAPDSSPTPVLPSVSWAPGLAAAALLGPKGLRHAARAAPQARSRTLLLRDLVEAGEAEKRSTQSCQAGQRGPQAASAGAALVSLGLLVLMLRWTCRSPSLPPGEPPEHTTELALECTKVACVGASITRGNVVVLGGELASDAPYPKQLQALLGPGYCVENFGVPDATVLKQSRFPYWKQPQLKQIRRFLPDVVVIQFGANDSREKNFERDFRQDYASMIAFFRNLPSRPQVYIMAMPPIYPGTASKDGIPGKKYGMDRDRLDNLRVPLNLIAKENDLSPPISVLSSFKKHCPDMSAKCSWMSGDGVHPNRHGDAAMARLVHLTVRGDDFCTALEGKKEQCGDPFNVTEATCKDRGCCYLPDSEGSPWCFKKLPAVRARPQECDASHDEKTDCGFEGDTMEQCMDRGCCYKPSLDGTPWCFHRLQLQHPHSAPAGAFVKNVTTTSWSTSTRTTVTTTTTPAATTTRTSTSSTTSTTTTTTTASAFWQARVWLIWLLVSTAVFLVVLAAFLLFVLPWWQQFGKEEKQPDPLPFTASAEFDFQQRQADEEQRQLRRLQVDRAMRSAEKKRAESERQRSMREVQTMLDDAGFAGVNAPRTKRGLFRASFTYPLHAAVEANNPEAIRALLKAGADANLADSKKRTPLALAEQLNKRESHAEVIAMLTSNLL